MAGCPYSETKGEWGLGGWWCGITGENCDSSLVDNYCKWEKSCEYCPYRGGDDRYRKEPEPEPESTEYSSQEESSYSSYPDSSTDSDYTSYSRASSGTGSSTGTSFIDILFSPFYFLISAGFTIIKYLGILVIILLAIYLVGSWVGVNLGLIKSQVTFEFELPTNSSPEASEINIYAVSADKGHKVYTASIDDSTSAASLKLKKGTYSVNLEFNGSVWCYSDLEVDGRSSYSGSLSSLSPLSFYLICVELYDVDGNRICPDEAVLYDNYGNETVVPKVMDGIYCYMCTYDSETSGADYYRFSADGMETEELLLELNDRVNMIQVVLHNR